jgi:hypothetical protein
MLYFSKNPLYFTSVYINLLKSQNRILIISKKVLFSAYCKALKSNLLLVLTIIAKIAFTTLMCMGKLFRDI